MSRPLEIWAYPGLFPVGSETEAALLRRRDIWAEYRESRGVVAEGDEYSLKIVSEHIADFEASAPDRCADLPLTPAEIFEVQTDEKLRVCRATLDNAGLPYDRAPVVFEGVDEDGGLLWQYARLGGELGEEPLEFAMGVAPTHSRPWFAAVIILHHRAAAAATGPAEAARSWALFGEAWTTARILYGSAVIAQRRQRRGREKAIEARSEKAAARRDGDTDDAIGWHETARKLAAELRRNRLRTRTDIAKAIAPKVGRSARQVQDVIKTLWK